MRTRFSSEIINYIEGDSLLFEKVIELWSNWDKKDNLNMNKVVKDFLQLIIYSPNIQNTNAYIRHSLLVSEKCKEFSDRIIENYPILENQLISDQLAFMGLIEDSFYLIGNSESNPYHEILTQIQLEHMGYKDLADGLSLHFVSKEILKEEHKKGNFKSVNFPLIPPLTLDILTTVDALCTTHFLPAVSNSNDEALQKRIYDIINRRPSGHPLTEGLKYGGAKRLEETMHRVYVLLDHKVENKYIEKIYL